MSVNIETIRTKDRLLISIRTENMKAEEIDDFLCSKPSSSSVTVKWRKIENRIEKKRL